MGDPTTIGDRPPDGIVGWGTAPLCLDGTARCDPRGFRGCQARHVVGAGSGVRAPVARRRGEDGGSHIRRAPRLPIGSQTITLGRGCEIHDQGTRPLEITGAWVSRDRG